MRRWVLAAGATALIVLPTVLAFFSGGFFDEPRIIAALVAWALVVLAALFSPRPLPVSTAGRLALLGLALLCGWTALSLTWAPIGGRAQDDLQRLLLYLGVFTAALALAARDPRVRRALEPALALGAFVVDRLRAVRAPAAGADRPRAERHSAGRLEQPLTYWNAYGILAALGFVLAVRVAGDPDRAAGAAVGARRSRRGPRPGRVPQLRARRPGRRGRRACSCSWLSRPSRVPSCEASFTVGMAAAAASLVAQRADHGHLAGGRATRRGSADARRCSWRPPPPPRSCAPRAARRPHAGAVAARLAAGDRGRRRVAGACGGRPCPGGLRGQARGRLSRRGRRSCPARARSTPTATATGRWPPRTSPTTR